MSVLEVEHITQLAKCCKQNHTMQLCLPHWTRHTLNGAAQNERHFIFAKENCALNANAKILHWENLCPLKSWGRTSDKVSSQAEEHVSRLYPSLRKTLHNLRIPWEHTWLESHARSFHWGPDAYHRSALKRLICWFSLVPCSSFSCPNLADGLSLPDVPAAPGSESIGAKSPGK